jgi:sterile alpha motif and leucine zipper containing kinase AZK
VIINLYHIRDVDCDRGLAVWYWSHSVVNYDETLADGF